MHLGLFDAMLRRIRMQPREVEISVAPIIPEKTKLESKKYYLRLV
jgi:hypothetical protein